MKLSLKSMTFVIGSSILLTQAAFAVRTNGVNNDEDYVNLARSMPESQAVGFVLMNA